MKLNRKVTWKQLPTITYIRPKTGYFYGGFMQKRCVTVPHQIYQLGETFWSHSYIGLAKSEDGPQASSIWIAGSYTTAWPVCSACGITSASPTKWNTVSTGWEVAQYCSNGENMEQQQNRLQTWTLLHQLAQTPFGLILEWYHIIVQRNVVSYNREWQHKLHSIRKLLTVHCFKIITPPLIGPCYPGKASRSLWQAFP